MAGRARHYFPGNNTPGGFFSYYHDILEQTEAEKIWCIKGGPGVGKSTFMRRIGEDLLADGHEVDFLHCSSDNNSLDGIVDRDQKIALVDGTSPHVVDPQNPGAVDVLINLGDFWNEAGIRKNRIAMIETNERIHNIFDRAYSYLAAAEDMYDTVCAIEQKKMKVAELHKIAATMISDELTHREIGKGTGHVKRFFASAITPNGMEHFLPTLLSGFQKTYLINTPIGTGCERILNLFMESAQIRGYDAQAFYCPIKPKTKIEHLFIPELSLAIVTSNPYHPISPSDCGGTTVTIDISSIITEDVGPFESEVEADCLDRMDDLLKRAVYCLDTAKKEHDLLETYYVPNMDFTRVEALRKKIVGQLRER